MGTEADYLIDQNFDRKHDEYGTKLDCEICYVVRERDRILAAIKDDGLVTKMMDERPWASEDINAYRAALMERIEGDNK
jgi:hypothetical protein